MKDMITSAGGMGEGGGWWGGSWMVLGVIGGAAASEGLESHDEHSGEQRAAANALEPVLQVEESKGFECEEQQTVEQNADKRQQEKLTPT